MTNVNPIAEVKDVFVFYQEFLKPIYAEIEAEENEIPVELLFETYAAFDHLKRFYLDKNNKDISIGKAISHLKRGALDGFKLKLKHFNDNIKPFSSIDLTLLDNGEFIQSFLRDKKEIMELAKQARLNEGKHSVDQAFDYWNKTYVKITMFEDQYFKYRNKIGWVKRKTFKYITKDHFLAYIMGVLSTVTITYFSDIIKYIEKLFHV